MIMTNTEAWVAEVNRLAQLVDDYAKPHDTTKYPESYNYNALVSAYAAACKGVVPRTRKEKQ